MASKFSSPYQLINCSYKLTLHVASGRSDYQAQSFNLNGVGAL